MANFSNTYSDGAPKWMINKNHLDTVTPQEEVDSSTISGLLGTDIKTNVQNVSIKIISNNLNLGHFELEKISSVVPVGSAITIYSADEVPTNLIFISTAEASLGHSRITSAINGGLLV